MFTERLETGAGIAPSESRERLAALLERDKEIVAALVELQPRLDRFVELANVPIAARAELAQLGGEYRFALDQWIAEGGHGDAPPPAHAGKLNTLRREVENALAAKDAAERAKAQTEAQRQQLVEERARIGGAADVESALILAQELAPVVESFLVERAALQERFQRLDEAVKSIGDLSRRVRDEVASRGLLLAQNRLLNLLHPHDLDPDRMAAASAARALEATRVKHEIARFMSALGTDPRTQLQLDGRAS
jgi:hypothetical protein